MSTPSKPQRYSSHGCHYDDDGHWYDADDIDPIIEERDALRKEVEGLRVEREARTRVEIDRDYDGETDMRNVVVRLGGERYTVGPNFFDDAKGARDLARLFSAALGVDEPLSDRAIKAALAAKEESKP